MDPSPEVAAISGKLESSKNRLCPLWVTEKKSAFGYFAPCCNFISPQPEKREGFGICPEKAAGLDEWNSFDWEKNYRTRFRPENGGGCQQLARDPAPAHYPADKTPRVLKSTDELKLELDVSRAFFAQFCKLERFQ